MSDRIMKIIIIAVWIFALIIGMSLGFSLRKTKENKKEISKIEIELNNLKKKAGTL